MLLANTANVIRRGAIRPGWTLAYRSLPQRLRLGGRVHEAGSLLGYDESTPSGGAPSRRSASPAAASSWPAFSMSHHRRTVGLTHARATPPSAAGPLLARLPSSARSAPVVLIGDSADTSRRLAMPGAAQPWGQRPRTNCSLRTVCAHYDVAQTFGHRADLSIDELHTVPRPNARFGRRLRVVGAISPHAVLLRRYCFGTAGGFLICSSWSARVAPSDLLSAQAPPSLARLVPRRFVALARMFGSARYLARPALRAGDNASITRRNDRFSRCTSKRLRGTLRSASSPT